jgi:hypothetical protein
MTVGAATMGLLRLQVFNQSIASLSDTKGRLITANQVYGLVFLRTAEARIARVNMTDVGRNEDVIDTKFAESLKAQLAFQRKWQRLSMLAYVSSTILILVCSSLATLAAAKQMSDLAAYLAATATVLVALEKSMLFREKWKFHLAIATRLSVLSAEIETAQVPTAKIIEEYSLILRSYAESLPIAPREGS